MNEFTLSILMNFSELNSLINFLKLPLAYYKLQFTIQTKLADIFHFICDIIFFYFYPHDRHSSSTACDSEMRQKATKIYIS